MKGGAGTETVPMGLLQVAPVGLDEAALDTTDANIANR